MDNATVFLNAALCVVIAIAFYFIGRNANAKQERAWRDYAAKLNEQRGITTRMYPSQMTFKAIKIDGNMEDTRYIEITFAGIPRIVMPTQGGAITYALSRQEILDLKAGLEQCIVINNLLGEPRGQVADEAGNVMGIARLHSGERQRLAQEYIDKGDFGA